MRKLATAALSFAAAIFAANYILPVGWLIVPAVLTAVLGAALAASRRRWLRGAVIALLAFSLGLMNYYVQYWLTYGEAEKLAGQTRTVELRLLSYPTAYEDYCRAEALAVSPDMPRLKAIVYDSEAVIESLRPGAVVRAECTVRTADTLYGENYDNYNARDIYLRLSFQGEAEVLKSGFDIRSLPAYISRGLSERIERVFPDDTAAFMRSLMLGDKSELYGDEALICHMSAAGFMHIVAVSGMHVAFLVGFLRLLLGASRRSSIICIALVWCFALITGAGPSAVRAALMQSVLLLAPIVYRENDPLTSLSAALALILLKNPFAAASVSLQLSFGAMAGIILFAGRIYGFLKERVFGGRDSGAVRYILSSAASSLAVMVLTVPLTALHFGYVPLLSAITNLAALWSVSLCFCGGWLCCLLSLLPYVGVGAAWLCSWLARYVFLVSGLVADIPFAVLYTQTPGAWLWIVLTYAAFAAAVYLKSLKPVLRCLLPALLSVSVLAGVFISAHYRYRRGEGCVSVIDVGQGQSVAAMLGDSTVLIDCGNIFSTDNAGKLAGAYLKSCGRDRLDLLVLSHLHSDHANGVTTLMELLSVETLLLPEDADDPEGLLEGILRTAQKQGTEIHYVNSDCNVSTGDIRLEVYVPDIDGDANESCMPVKLDLGELDALISSDSYARQERELICRTDPESIELLVVGHHGSKYSSDEDFLRALGARYAVISTGYNTYGHPTQEVLERLANCGYNIYRTDMDGTVEIRMGRDDG